MSASGAVSQVTHYMGWVEDILIEWERGPKPSGEHP